MFNPGNFALYNKKRIIVLATENNNVEILDITNSTEMTVQESELEIYNHAPLGMAPVSLSPAQKHMLDAICATLGYQFNGLCMHDVSTFIGLFKEKSLNKKGR